MKRILSILLALAFLFSLAPTSYAEAAPTCKIQITVADMAGQTIDLTNAYYFVKSGQNIMWGNGRRSGGYGLGEQIGKTYDQNMEFWLKAPADVTYSISLDLGDSVFFIEDTVARKDLATGKILNKTYSLKNLKTVALKTTFMNRTTGSYSFSVYNPKNMNYEMDNYGSTATMKADGTKNLLISPGKFNFVFKYTDQGVCAMTCKSNVDTAVTKSMVFAKESVSLLKYSYKIPPVLSAYDYYIMHVSLNSGLRVYLKGLFSQAETLDLYMDKAIPAGSQRLVLSKDPEDEYEEAVWIFSTTKTPPVLGNLFRPGIVSTSKTYDGKLSITVYFTDLNGNTIHFTSMNQKQDLLIEVYNRVTGELLSSVPVSKYWDYFDPKLKAGTYYARISPTEPVPGFNQCTFYDLKVDAKLNYTFTSLYSYQVVIPKPEVSNATGGDTAPSTPAPTQP